MIDVQIVVPDEKKVKVFTKLMEVTGGREPEVSPGETDFQTVAVFRQIENFDFFVKKAMCLGAVKAGRLKN